MKLKFLLFKEKELFFCFIQNILIETRVIFFFASSRKDFSEFIIYFSTRIKMSCSFQKQAPANININHFLHVIQFKQRNLRFPSLLYYLPDEQDLMLVETKDGNCDSFSEEQFIIFGQLKDALQISICFIVSSF